MSTAQVNGITMYYEVHGAGESLLLINGLGADITLLAPIISGLARQVRAVRRGSPVRIWPSFRASACAIRRRGCWQ
jgi:hypothetical protein